MKKLAHLLIIALFVGTTAAQVKNVAVVETEIDVQSGAAVKLNRTEVRQITAELRREAVKNLPRERYNIMTTETVQAQGGAVLEECAEENCVIALGSKIGADYIVRGTIRRTRTRFRLSVDIYETENGFLVTSSEAVSSENIEELIDKAAAACAEMYKTFANAHSSASRPEPKPPVLYTITAAANPPNGGSVSRNPNQTYYAAGTKANLTAVPANRYAFAGWSGDTTSSKDILTVAMNGDKTLTANFRYIQKTYRLTTNVFPQNGGSITCYPDKEIYAANEEVTVIATPATGYTFIDWLGAVSGRANRITIAMNRDRDVTARFYKKLVLEPKPEPVMQASVIESGITVQQTYTLTVNVFPQGSGCYVTRNPNKETYAADEVVTITAIPARGYKFTGWSGHTDSTTYFALIKIDGNKQLTANFQQMLPTINMIYVAGGTFTIGCTSEQISDCKRDEKPEREVTLSSYYISKYEVTQGLWKAIMGSLPSSISARYGMGDNYPVYGVSWNHVQKFISMLNIMTGKKYRLPSEAEWEYAARGGVNRHGYKYSGSDIIEDVAWYCDNSGDSTHPVGTKLPNELGIHDMSGNVWEWVSDRYGAGAYGVYAQLNPMGPSKGSDRVYRGGSWDRVAKNCRVSNRSCYFPDYENNRNIGFRLVSLSP